MVFVRIPRLTGGLEDSWDGLMNYKVAYQLRPWKIANNVAMHVILAMEDDAPDLFSLHQTLFSLLDKHGSSRNYNVNFSHILTTNPGSITILEHTFDSGHSTPLQTAPYRLAPAWKDQLCDVIQSLQYTGILEPAISP